MENELDKCPASEADETEAAVPAAGQPKKKSLAKRILKWVLWSVAGLLVFVLLAVLTLPLWINPVATSVAKSLVPKYTGTAFDIKDVELNPYTGKILISGVELANPEGYSEKDAFKLGKITADVEMTTLLSKTIHVREVTVEDLFASYVFDEGGVNNFDRIVEAVNEKLGPKKEKKEESSETKVVIDKVTVKNVAVAVGAGRFALASLTLTDFGRDDVPAKLEISDVELVNPPGFEAENAFSLGSLSVEMETGDLGKLPININKVVIDSPYASYVFDEQNVDNFTRMLEPLLAKDGEPEMQEKKAEKNEKSTGMPVTLDRLEVTNLVAQVCRGRFELASLVLTDFGKDTPTKLEISGVKLENPPEFVAVATNAFSLGSLSVSLETADLSKKPMVLHNIVIDSPYASYVFDEKNVDNFTRMLGPLLAKDGEPEKKDEKAEKAEKSSGTPVVLDRLEVTNLTALVCNGQFELASLVVKDFGKPTAAQIELVGAKLVNPDGFKPPNAFSLKSLKIGLETADLAKKPMVFHDIIVDSTYAGLVYNDAGDSNFNVMFKPLMGKEKKEKADEKKDEKKKDEDDTPRVVIDNLDISRVKLQWRMVTSPPISLPAFSIGKTSENGETLKEAARQVVSRAKDAMKDAMGSLGNFADILGIDVTSVLGDATEKAGEMKDKAMEKAGEMKDKAVEKAGEMKNKAIEGMKNAGAVVTGWVGGDKKDDDKKEDDKDGDKKDDKKNENDESGLMNKATDTLKSLNPLGK